jgi:hypothetical protein
MNATHPQPQLTKAILVQNVMQGGKKKTKEVAFPVFLEASQYIQDEYWKNFFMDLSKGKLARKIHISPKFVSHNGKKASFSYDYEGKTPEEIAAELKKVISNTLCIYSETDCQTEKKELTALGSEFRDAKTGDDWKKVKTRKMKDHLVTNYVLKMKAQLDLNWDRTKHLYEMLDSALNVYRTHKSADITMENGEISSIDDFEITANGFQNLRLEQEDVETISVPKKISLDKEWLKVCNQLAKKSRMFLNAENDEDVIKNDKSKKKKRAPSEEVVALPEQTNNAENVEELGDLGDYGENDEEMKIDADEEEQEEEIFDEREVDDREIDENEIDDEREEEEEVDEEEYE